MLLTLLASQAPPPETNPVATGDCWGGAWGVSWGVAWGSAIALAIREIEVDFGRSYVSPKVRKIINRTAKKAASKERQQEYAQSLRNEPSSDYFASLLKVELAKEQITPTRLYEVLLGQQIDNQVSAQIRRYLELLGVYERIAQEEDEERALMMLMMEL